jgi:metal-responsive CopG/Arc/MetJ family transcriptional regulator
MGQYNHVILRSMKTAISVPDETFARVDAMAGRLGVSRSEFYARAAERWLAQLEHDRTTEQIDDVLAGAAADGDREFVARAAARQAEAEDGW